MDVFDIKLDKMTIVADLKESDFLQVFVNNGILEAFDYGVDFLQGTLFPKVVFEESAHLIFDQRNAEVMKKRNFRLEFNPSKLTDTQKEFIKNEILVFCAPGSISFSRLDLALDCDKNIGSYTFETTHSKSGANFFGKSGSLTGKYLGQRESHVFTRIYDKKFKELKDKKRELLNLQKSKEFSSKYSQVKEDLLLAEIESLEKLTAWWRLEFELKGSKKIEDLLEMGLTRLFDTLRIIDYDFEGVSGLEKATLLGLRERPEIFEELSKNTRSKYKKMFRELQGEDLALDFKAALQKKEPLILAELKGWLVK